MENKQKFLLLTGASSGIGRALAIKLSENFNIILHGRNSDRLKETESLCSKGKQCRTLQLDLTKIDEIESSLADYIINNDIEIEHLVHCAGFMKMIPLKMINTGTLNTTFNTNVFSAILLTKTLTSRKVNNALKSVVFISSNVSNFGAKALSVYASSKSALDSIMRCLAVELAPRVRINSVLPGAIQTEMTEAIFANKETEERMAATYPLGIGKPEDIYEIVDFLLSDKARWITGQQFTVDGGRTINISG